MGTLTAILDKTGEDTTGTALNMLRTLSAERTDAYGIASPYITRTANSLEKLQRLKLNSNMSIGHTLSKILIRDEEQPLSLEKASFVFEGRIFPTDTRMSDAGIFAQKIQGNRTDNARKFIQETEGDFVFAIAEPEKLVAGRDLLGMRPLYYGESTIFAGIASERKALWAIGIKNVNSFPPGAIAEINMHGFRFSLAKRIVQRAPKCMTMKKASIHLVKLLRKAVNERTTELKRAAVSFSGGLDSSMIALLAKRTRIDVQLIHVSMANQAEIEHAREAAGELKLPIHVFTYSEADVLNTLPRVLRLIEEFDPVKASIGIPLYWVAENAAKLNCKILLAGQGGDELFGGYRRYVDEYVHEGRDKVLYTMFQDIVRLHEKNLERDFKICNSKGMELRLPFATNEIVNFALSLPLELKLEPNDNTLRKLVLRQAGRNLGLHESIVNRPKKAMQYATGISRTLNRIAKRKNQSLEIYLQSVFQTVFPELTTHG
jgi:asparagine synthase (glutamine-hydrolysing)